MAESLSLLEFIHGLLFDVRMRDHFTASPEKALEEHGLGDLSPADVYDALVLVEDNQTADFSNSYDASTLGYTLPAAPAFADGHDHQAAVRYLNEYITHNYVDDEADTVIDNSFRQDIDTHGGDLEQDVDLDSVVAAGQGSVVAGGGIAGSTFATGNGNLVGDGNQVVHGSGTTASFGSGTATSTNVGGDLTIGHGSGFASGGSASVDNTDNSVDDSFNEATDNSIENSGNTDLDVDLDDSFNDQSNNSTTNSGNDNSDNSVDDSFTVN